jgi:hypothetical protein
MRTEINTIGIAIWIPLFFILIPFRIIKKYPLTLIGFFYTIIILHINNKLIGNVNDKDNKSDFDQDAIKIVNMINTKAVQVSTAIFALALATKDMFRINFYKDLLIFMIYTLIFGVGIIVPIYFISNQTSYNLTRYNEILTRIRNVSLSYSIGFMMAGFMIAINRIYKLKIHAK